MGTKAEIFLAAALFVSITGAALSNSAALTEMAMTTTFGPFSSREVASATLLITLLSWAMVKSADVRESLVAIAAKAPFLLKWTSIMLTYYAAVVGVFFLLGIWHRGLIVPASLWILTVGVIAGFKSMSGQDQPVNFRAVFLASLIAGWFVSLYPFGFVVELMYQLLLAFLAVAAVLSKKADYKMHATVSGAYGGLALIAIVPPTIGLVQQPYDHKYIESLVLPVVGLFTLMPLVHAIGLYSLYEGIYVRPRVHADSDDVRRYALMRALHHFHVRRAALQRFRKAAARDLLRAQTRSEVEDVFSKHAG